MIGRKNDFFNCELIFLFQSDGCAEHIDEATCFIHYVISHLSDNIRLMLLFSTEMYARWVFFPDVFIYIFIYTSCW